VEGPEAGPTPRRIRLAILDDSPFLRFADGRVGPKAATFHRFAEAVVAMGGFERAAYLVPVEAAGPGNERGDEPRSLVDPGRLTVVATAPFDGIAGYVRHAPGLARRNWPVIRDAVDGADLVWIKAPASNALLALRAARRSHTPFFTWVAGSARAVVRGRDRNSGLCDRVPAPQDRVTIGKILLLSGRIHYPTVRLHCRVGGRATP